MGYCTDYNLSAQWHREDIQPTKLEIEQLEDEIEKLNIFDSSGDYLVGWWANEKWYDWEEDMAALSKKFPNFLFLLEGDGEYRDDVWGAYFLDGLIMRDARKIVVEAFDPGLLEQPCGLETQIVSNQEEIK